jgi:heptosyltransferase-2
MASQGISSKIVNYLFKKLLSVEENKSLKLQSTEKFLIVRQHNQLGDLLASVSLFRAIKENYPSSKITLIASPFNYPGLIKNRFVDEIFIFDKKKIYNPFYLMKFLNLIRSRFDVVVVPVVVSISFTSNLIARIAKAKIRIGPKSLDGIENKSYYFFDRRVILDWRKQPDSNVSERILDILRPFGISTTNYRSEISFDENDNRVAEEFISQLKLKANEFLIGLHVGAGKPANRWSLYKFVSLINKLNEKYSAKFYLTGSNSDKDEISFVTDKLDIKIKTFINKKIYEVAALISKSDLFITNDTGIMHVAGTTKTPQVSIFGPTNPFNWAPIGGNKYFIRKSELIDDVSLDDVFKLCVSILEKKEVIKIE